ncbi:MAG: hypothetical protein FWE09_06035 [Treponema sp.]|nr:hypothetical protein [Treponema sp.]
MKRIGIVLLAAALFPALLMTACSGTSGKDVAALILGVSQTPVFISARALSETQAVFEFSKPVSVDALRFDPEVEIEAIEDGSTVTALFSGALLPGQRVVAEILAVDESGNTIHVLAPFRARNDRVPPLLITELRTEYSNPRAEFIEMLTTGAGNMGGLRVFIASNTSSPLVYEFPPVEARSGERITLHLRQIEPESRDELGDNLAESGGRDASPTARDLWVPGSAKLLRKTDIVYILDQDDNVLDAVALSETSGATWPRSAFSDAADFLHRAGAWHSADGIALRPSDAVMSAGTTNTRTINRDESLSRNSRSASDWYITVTSGATPGRPNNPGRFGN